MFGFVLLLLHKKNAKYKKKKRSSGGGGGGGERGGGGGKPLRFDMQICCMQMRVRHARPALGNDPRGADGWEKLGKN